MKIKRKSGAPFGNKNGLGYGRPPNPGYNDDELIILGEELITWMLQADQMGLEIVHLSEWYSGIKGIPRSQWKSIKQRDCFFPYYERAICWMGIRVLKNKALPTAYGSRFLAIYFREIAEHERSLIEHKIDYELSKKTELEIRRDLPPNDHFLNLILELIKENQILKSKIQELSIN